MYVDQLLGVRRDEGGEARDDNYDGESIGGRPQCLLAGIIIAGKKEKVWD